MEKNVQDSRRRIWIEAARRRFSSFVELNAWLGERCRALWSEVRHPEHGQFSVAEMLKHERPHLIPMPEPFDGYVEKPARVSSTCLVSVARNRYSAPCELAGQMASTRLYPTSVVVVADDAVVARHERLSDSGGTRYDWQHYIPQERSKGRRRLSHVASETRRCGLRPPCLMSPPPRTQKEVNRQGNAYTYPQSAIAASASTLAHDSRGTVAHFYFGADSPTKRCSCDAESSKA